MSSDFSNTLSAPQVRKYSISEGSPVQEVQKNISEQQQASSLAFSKKYFTQLMLTAYHEEQENKRKKKIE